MEKVESSYTIISGVEPNFGGVGQVVRYLIQNFNLNSIYPGSERVSIKMLMHQFKIIEILKELYIRSKSDKKKEFKRRLRFHRDRNILIIHPQSIGFQSLKKILKNNNVSLYLMDNSFFCLKSYNYISGYDPCFACLSGKYDCAIEKKCIPFPIRYTIEDNIVFLNLIYSERQKIDFWCQNIEQQKLLLKHLGRDIRSRIVGLIPNDFIDLKPFPNNLKKNVFDFVLHANDVEAKGMLYAFEIARRNPERSFLFPFNKPKKYIELITENMYFIPVTWNSGLSFFVQHCEVVLCLSLWSAPIEGAFLKSIKLNNKVAVYCAPYSYYKEVPENLVLKLYGRNVEEDEKKLLQYYNKTSIINGNQEYLDNYLINSKKCIRNALCYEDM